MTFKISRSGFIHLVRWIAALLVVISHLRSFIFVDFNEVIHSSSLVKAFYFVSGLGHQSVIVFFVLSGFLVGQSVLNQIKNNKFNFTIYSINRAARLYSVLIVALILTFLFDSIGQIFDVLGVYDGRLKFSSINFNISERQGFNYFFSSLFMLQNSILPPFGSNGPLWSLANEFWYYVLFPLNCVIIFHLIKGIFSKKTFFIAIAITIAACCFISTNITTYYLLWIIGLLPIYVKSDRKIFKLLIPFVILLFLLFQRSKPDIFPPILADVFLALLFSCWLSMFADFKLENTFYKFNDRMASFSYTLYLIHFPFSLLILTLTNHFFETGFKMQPSLISFLIFITLVVLCLIFSLMIAYLTEFKTQKFKNLLSRAIVNRSIESKTR